MKEFNAGKILLPSTTRFGILNGDTGSRINTLARTPHAQEARLVYFRSGAMFFVHRAMKSTPWTLEHCACNIPFIGKSKMRLHEVDLHLKMPLPGECDQEFSHLTPGECLERYLAMLMVHANGVAVGPCGSIWQNLRCIRFEI